MTQQGRPTRRAVGRGIASAGAVLALAAAGALAATALASAAPRALTARILAPAARTLSGPLPARVARTVSVNDTGHLERIHASGNILVEAGKISGTLPGTATVRLNVGPETVTASFTIKPHGGGSIVGAGSAKIGSPGRYTSFSGTLSVTGGTGRFAHAHGAGKLYGVIERRYDLLTVQTREGTLHY